MTKFDLLDRSDRKNYKYQKSKTAAAAVLKKNKNPHNYIGRDWSDLVNIWHSEAVRNSWRFRQLKIQNF